MWWWWADHVFPFLDFQRTRISCVMRSKRASVWIHAIPCNTRQINGGIAAGCRTFWWAPKHDPAEFTLRNSVEKSNERFQAAQCEHGVRRIWRFWSHLRKFPLFWETSKSEFRNAEMFRRSEFLLGHRHRFRFRRFREAPKGELLVDQSRTSPGRGAAQRSGVEWRKLSREEETKKRRCFKHF